MTSEINQQMLAHAEYAAMEENCILVLGLGREISSVAISLGTCAVPFHTWLTYLVP